MVAQLVLLVTPIDTQMTLRRQTVRSVEWHLFLATLAHFEHCFEGLWSRQDSLLLLQIQREVWRSWCNGLVLITRRRQKQRVATCRCEVIEVHLTLLMNHGRSVCAKVGLLLANRKQRRSHCVYSRSARANANAFNQPIILNLIIVNNLLLLVQAITMATFYEEWLSLLLLLRPRRRFAHLILLIVAQILLQWWLLEFLAADGFRPFPIVNHIINFAIVICSRLIEFF